MTSVLRPDDFEVGMFLTIKDLRKDTSEFADEGMSNPLSLIMHGGGMSSTTSHLEMLKGRVIRVDAVNLPFIMTTIFENITNVGQPPKTHYLALDVRDSEFMKLNEEYVKAYLGVSPLIALLQGESFNSIQNIEGYNNLAGMVDMLIEQLKKEDGKNKNENT